MGELLSRVEEAARSTEEGVQKALRVKVRVAGLVALLDLSGAGLVYPEAIAQEVMGQHRWRMATGPTSSLVSNCETNCPTGDQNMSSKRGAGRNGIRLRRLSWTCRSGA